MRKPGEVFGIKFDISKTVIDNKLLCIIENILIKIKNVQLSEKESEYNKLLNNNLLGNNLTVNPNIHKVMTKIFEQKQCDDKILEIINGEDFVGVGLLGSDTKGKGIVFNEGSRNSSGDIDLIFFYKGNYNEENFKLLNEYICELTNRKQCDVYNYLNENIHINLDKIEYYVKNKDFSKTGDLFRSYYGDINVIDNIRIELSKKILENFNNNELNILDKYIKYHFIPFKEKDFKSLPRTISILKNLIFDQNHYLFIKTLIDGLSKYHIKNTLEYYANLEKK